MYGQQLQLFRALLYSKLANSATIRTALWIPVSKGTAASSEVLKFTQLVRHRLVFSWYRVRFRRNASLEIQECRTADNEVDTHIHRVKGGGGNGSFRFTGPPVCPIKWSVVADTSSPPDSSIG